MLRAFLAVLALLIWAPQARAQQLSAADFTAGASMRAASISPDGNFVAAIQGVEGGEALVIIDWRTRRAQAIQVARYDRSLFLEGVAWKNDGRLLFWVRQRITQFNQGTGSRQRSDVGETDVVRIYGVNRDGSNLTQLFENSRLALETLSVELIDPLRNDPDNVLMGTWGNAGFTLYRVSVTNGRTAAVEDAAWETFGMMVNRDGRAIMRIDALPYNSGYRYFRRPASGGRWTVAHEVRRGQSSQNRDFAPIAAGPGPNQVYVAARAEGEDFQAIYLYDTNTGELGAPLFRQPNADAAIAWVNAADNTVLIACAETRRFECRATDPAMQRHFNGLAAYFENRADFAFGGSSANGQYWLVTANGPTVPPTYYVYDVAGAQISAVGQMYPNIPRAALADTRTVDYTSRDGAALWGYLTTPNGRAGPYPTVIMPHGGPQSRDSYGYDFLVQFLVNHGYAVFQPNFRGSEGSGRSFARAGYRQWGGVMQDDITDSVQHLIASGVADRERICIAGISYGGYAALAGAALTPDLYKCAISIAGLSDLPELIETERADSGRRSALFAWVQETVGDPSENRQQLIDASPRRHVENITIPVLLIHGEKDETTLPAQSERMRDALQRGKSVRYVEIEGNVYHPRNGWWTHHQRRLLEEMETFLNANIGAGAP